MKSYTIMHIIVTFVHVDFVYGIQSFERTPVNKTSIIGDTVYFHCGVNNKSGELQWTKDGFGLGMEEDLIHLERYSMIILNDNINFDLEIRNVTLDDEGVFQCQVGPGFDGSKPIKSKQAFLTVEVPTSAPVIIQGDSILVVKNKETQLDCISRGGKPAPEVLWIDDNGVQLKTGVELVQELMEDNKRFNIRSVMRFKGSPKHLNQTFTCQVYNKPSSSIMIARVRIQYGYPPMGYVEVQPVITREFENFQAFCHVNASPPINKLLWRLNGQLLVGESSNELVFHNVSRKDHQSTLACYTENDVGNGLFKSILSVFYGPRFQIYPRDVNVEIGTMFTLYCFATANPIPLTFWMHEASSTIVHHGSNYTDRLTYHNQGNYSCHAQVEGYPAIKTMVSVNILGPPKIISKAVQFGVNGEKVVMECVARSNAIPTSLFWTRFGHKLETKILKHNIIEESVPYGLRSLVLFNHTQEHHFGEYTCTATNFYGNDSVDINLTNKSAQKYFGLLLYFAGALFVIVVLCAVTVALCINFASSKDNLILDTKNHTPENVLKHPLQICTDNTNLSEQPNDRFDFCESSNQFTREPNMSKQIQKEFCRQNCDAIGSFKYSSEQAPNCNTSMRIMANSSRIGNMDVQHTHPFISPRRIHRPSIESQKKLAGFDPRIRSPSSGLKLHCKIDTTLPATLFSQSTVSTGSGTLRKIAAQGNAIKLKEVSLPYKKISHAQLPPPPLPPFPPTISKESATCLTKCYEKPPPPPLPPFPPTVSKENATCLTKCYKKNELSSDLDTAKDNLQISARDMVQSKLTYGLQHCLQDIQNGVHLKPTKIKRSITLGPTEGLSRAIANAIDLRKSAVNPESSNNSSDDDKEFDWQ